MKLKPIFSAAGVAVILLGSVQAARADDDWQGPRVIFGFGGPAYYPPPPPVYYNPPPPPPAYYYAPQPAYAAPGYYGAPGYGRWHHHDDEEEDQSE